MALTPARIPLSTYRLQFGPHLRFRDAIPLAEYLQALGISEAYASPVFRAREHSSHGYDVVDHSAVDPELGTEDEFRTLAEALRGRGLGLMMDVVPNHMGIDDQHNLWWQDVLENGPSSVYARYFDIDWEPPKETLRGKVLLPFLGEQYGKVLENQEIRLLYEDLRFQIGYCQQRFPVAPGTWNRVLKVVLEHVGDALGVDDPQRMELESIMTALDNLPLRSEQDPERVQQRYREKEVVRRRLAALCQESTVVKQALDRTLEAFNGKKGDPRSFDRLEALLAAQVYRLCHWRVATDEINYRRFFDINALAAVRVEHDEVFQRVHSLVFRALEHGWVTELRIDHPDGLADPKQYFAKLQDVYAQRYRDAAAAETTGADLPASGAAAAEASAPAGAAPATAGRVAPPLYVAVEKILMHDENLDPQWPVCGTTGYEFLNQLNGLFVDRRGVYALRGVYSRFTGQSRPFSDILYQSKRAILNLSMSSELHVLAWQLDRISEQHRWSRDFTRSSLIRALREVIASFPVYRTYIRPDDLEPSPEDRRRIVAAIRTAKRRNPEMSPSFFDFIGSVLLLQDPEQLGEADRQARRQFVLKFQQVTGPVMAKGMEDTAFYRYYPLASLAEVGGDPSLPGVVPEQFHRANAQRAAAWPHALSATATHDTKRGEDLRARLNVLSETPAAWEQALRRWQQQNAVHRAEIEGEAVPDANEEYLLYQTLVGTWPLDRSPAERHAVYVDRIVAYMDKALKEAKLHSSWTNPDQEYETGVTNFIRAILDERVSGEFMADMTHFVSLLADAGFVNSLAQTLLKIASPGVPDFYQGTELWDFSLVDPDNRRPVDFARRQRLLAELQAQDREDPAGLVTRLMQRWPDESVKLHVIQRALAMRRRQPELFLEGDYQPLEIDGPRAEHLCALARRNERRWLIAVVPRLTLAACQREEDLAAAVAVGQNEAAGGALSGGHYGAAPRKPAPSRLADGSFAAWWHETRVRLPLEAGTDWHDALSDTHYTALETDEGVRLLDAAELLARLPVALLCSESTTS